MNRQQQFCEFARVYIGRYIDGKLPAAYRACGNLEPLAPCITTRKAPDRMALKLDCTDRSVYDLHAEE